MKYALWIVQVLLALAFFAAGAMKLTQPIDALAAQLAWPGDVPEGLVRFIGAAELLGAIGLIVPAATRILPWFTPLAALGLGLIMVLATVFHITRGEFIAVPVTLVQFALATFVVYGRRRSLTALRPSAAPAGGHTRSA